MKIKYFIFGLLVLTDTSLYSSNIRLSYKTTKESKEDEKFKSLVQGDKSVKQEKLISINQVIISDKNLIINVDSSNHTNTVFDFNQESISTYDYTNKLYSRAPLFYVVHYKISEFQNRNGLAGALQAGGVEDAFGSLFSRESLFGIEDTKDALKAKIKINKEKKINAVKYVYNKNNVASIEYSEYPIKENYKKMFEKFLVYSFFLHPIIIQDIINNGYLPKNIEYTYSNIGTKTSVKMELLKFISDDSSLQEFTDFSKMSVDTTQNDTLKNIINKIYATVLKGNFELINKQRCVNYSTELIKKEKYLDALLCLMEYLLQSGDKPTEAIQNAISFAEKDTNMQIFIRCLQSKTPAEDKISQLISIPLAKYEKGYIVNIFLANYYNNVDAEKSFDCFQKTLMKSQYITGVYKDIGDLYAGKYDMESAWKCYDIALHINKQHSMSQDIENLKIKLRTDFPVYFINK